VFVNLSGVGYRLRDVIAVDGAEVIENTRTPVVAIESDLHASFSRVNAHTLYNISGDTLYRLNTETNTQDDGTGFPKAMTAYLGGGSTFNWIMVSENDEYISMLEGGRTGWLRYKPATNTVDYFTAAELTDGFAGGLDEVYMTDNGLFALVVGDGLGDLRVLDLTTGFMTAPAGGTQQWEHGSTAGGAIFCALNPDPSTIPYQYIEAVTVSVDGQAFPSITTVTSGVTGVGASTSSGHHRRPGDVESQFVLCGANWTSGGNIGDGTWAVHSGQIYKCTNFRDNVLTANYEWRTRGVNDIWQRVSAGSSAMTHGLTKVGSVGAMVEGTFYYDVATGDLYIWAFSGGEPDDRLVLSGFSVNHSGMAVVKLDGSEIRYVGPHFSLASTYQATPKAHISQDGGFVMFSSDGGDPSGRCDVYGYFLPMEAA
jgi:hypothetical protein